MVNNSDLIELRISIVDAEVTKTLQLDPEVVVYQLCDVIRNNIREAQTKHPKHYGLFLPHDDWRKGLWLDTTKTLQHYIIRRGDTVEYRNRFRWLHIRTMDSVKKQLKVDDSWTVAEIMLTICSKLGIYNYDEYSLISEESELSPNAEKTLSMKRPIALSRDQDKFDKLKRKYHTEDGLNWLNPSQSLRQQGIEESESLLVKRKYFFSDMNVDSRDPIQLGLLYMQLKDAVINGTHPVTFDEAIELGGIQCHVQFGPYSADKFKHGFLDLKEFLPKEYLRSFKNVEKKLFARHLTMKDFNEEEAKEKYCILCRSLKTYGITFFLVKEKVKGKNKLIPRLLGVNRDSVVQVDEKSKEIVNKWPLTSIKKWAASFSGFTMDFGEYSPDEYYTAQTDKGEKISQLIAGYIDIILKRKKAKDNLTVDADEECVMEEDIIAPSKAIIVEHVPKHIRPSVSEEDVILRKSVRTTNSSVRYSSQASDSMYSQDAYMSQEDIILSRQTSMARTQSPDSSLTTNSLHYRLSEEDIKQKLYVLSLQDNLSTIESYKEQLTVNLGPVLGKDESNQRWIYTNMENSRQRMTDEIGAMNAAVAQVLRSAQGLTTIDECEEEEMNEEIIAKMQNSFSLITVHLPSLMEEIKTSAYYHDQLHGESASGEDLIAAAKRLADAFTDLIKAAYPCEDEKRSLNRKAIFEAAGVVGEASSELLLCISEQETSHDEIKVDKPYSITYISEQEQIYQEELLRLAKAVANATTTLIKQVKIVAVEADDPEKQRKVITAATDTGMSISQLIATTKMVAPTIQQPVCQEQMIFSVEYVKRVIVVIVECANNATQSKSLQDNTNEAALGVQEALDDLMEHLKKGTHKNANLDNFLLACEDIQKLDVKTDDTNKLLEAARNVANTTANMITEIQLKIKEEETDSEECRKLIDAVCRLSVTSSELVECAKGCTSDSEEIRLRNTLKEVIGRFVVITYTSECADIFRDQVIDHLLVAARNAISESTNLINTSQTAAKKSRVSNYKVCSDGRDVSDRIPIIISIIKEARRDPKDHLTQLELIGACREFIDPSEQLSQSSKYMWPSISDPALRNALNHSINHSVIATDELRRCVHQADSICQHLDLSAALEQLKRLQRSLKDIKMSIELGNLIALPDEQAEESATMLIRSIRHSGSAANHLKHDLEDRCMTYEQNAGEDKYINIEHLDTAGKKARELSRGLDQLVQAARGVAASIQLESQDEESDIKEKGKEAQMKIIGNSLNAVESAYDLVQEAKIAPPNSEEMRRIQVASVRLSDALSSCLDSLPGQRDLDMLNDYIESKKHKFNERKLPVEFDKNLGISGYQSEMTDASLDFNQGVNELVSAQSFNVVNSGCRKLRSSYDRLVDTSYATSERSTSRDDLQFHFNKDGISNCVMTMSNESQAFLKCVKEAQCEPDNIEIRRKLQDSARSLLHSVNRLLATSSSNIRPGEKECDKVILRLQGVRPTLANPIHPLSNKNYYECLDCIVERTMEPLAESLKIIPSAIKDENSQKFIDAIYQCSDCICLLLEETAQAAYLIGIGDVHSKIGNTGLADHSSFRQIQKEIADNCFNIYDRENDAREVMNTAAQIAENCRKLCEASKMVMVSCPNDKVKLSDKTKVVLIVVTDLMTEVQRLNTKIGEENRILVQQLSEKVQVNVAELIELILACNFAGNAAFISDKAKEAQAPIKEAGISVLDGAIDVVVCAKELISQCPTEQLYFSYSSHCKDLNEALKRLIFIIKDSAPGQKECDKAMKLVAELLKQARDSKIKVIKNRSRVPSNESESEGTYQKILQSVLLQMPHCVEDLSRAGKREPEQLAHVLSRLTQLLESMASSCMGASLRADLIQNSTIYLEHEVTVLEASEQFLRAIKKSGGNPKASMTHMQIDEMSQGLKESCNDLLLALDKISVKQENLGVVVETINKSRSRVQESAILPSETKFSNAQSKMLEICYEMDDLRSGISNATVSESTQKLAAPLITKLTQNYDELCLTCQSAVTIINNEAKGKNLQLSVHNVGASLVDLVKSTSNKRPTSVSTVQQLQTRSDELHQRIQELIKVLIDHNVGTQACSQAIRILKEINKDICRKKNVIDPSLGEPLNNGYRDTSSQFSAIKNSVISNSNLLVDNIKEIVAKDDTKLDQLTENANKIASSAQDLSNEIQYGIDFLSHSTSEHQMQLYDALQEVVLALISLLEETRDSCDLHYNDPSLCAIQEKGKHCVRAITHLLKVFKTKNEGNMREFHAIDSSIIELEKDYASLSNIITEATRESTTPIDGVSVGSDVIVIQATASEEIKRLIPPLSNALKRILEQISPNKSQYQQEELIAASVYCTKVNGGLVTACKNLIENGQYSDSKLKTTETAKEIVGNYVHLLKNLKNHLNNQSKQTQNDVVNSNRQITELIKSLHQDLESLREGPRLVMYFRPSSPEWRDVSEKYIGRHVAYHHCYVKSYSHGSHTHLYHHSSTLIQIPLNSQDPSDVDVDNAKKQIKYVTTKLLEIKPHPDLIGCDKYTVAEVDQLLAYVKDMGVSVGELLATTHVMCKKTPKDILDGVSKRSIYRAAIGVANAMKELCEATNTSLSSGSIIDRSDDKLRTSAKKVANSTTQLILNLKESMGHDQQPSRHTHVYGKRIKADADSFLVHLSYLNEKNPLNVVSCNDTVSSMNEVNETCGFTAESDKEPGLACAPNNTSY